jgi:hypothetical protein
MNYARRRSQFFSRLSLWLYDAHRWCEWQSLLVAVSATARPQQLFDHNTQIDGLAILPETFITLNPGDVNIRDAIIRGYIAPRLTPEYVVARTEKLGVLATSPSYEAGEYEEDF